MSFWENYLYDLKELQKSGAVVFCIGYSVLQRPIFCIQIGKGQKKILLQYAIHAREHITYHLAILHAKKLLNNIPNATIFIIPLSNPDGVCLAIDGIKSVNTINQQLQNYAFCFPFYAPPQALTTFKIQQIKKNLLRINNNANFSLWKANINGVDLNVNFDALWGTGKQNITIPNSENYIGRTPHSEPETQCLTQFTLAIKPNVTISYHSKGEVIYYGFKQSKQGLSINKHLAKIISKSTTYPIQKSTGSAGGYKDWCIQKLHIPALTIEIGKDSYPHPISKKHLLSIWQQNKNVIDKTLDFLHDFNI